VTAGKHDRRRIADFLSKTFKCTHGIKFRPRSSGKRSRHKLRDIGCPFHLYASAVEYGPTYRVKVRVNDQHNHPIGPDAIKAVSAMRSDLSEETGTTSSASLGITTPTLRQVSAPATASSNSTAAADQLHTSTPSPFAHDANVDAHLSQAQVQSEALRQAFAQVHAQALLKSQEQAHAHALSHTREHAMIQSHPVQASTASLLAQEHHGNERQSRASSSASASDLLDNSGHDSETLLARAIESTIEEEVFISSAPASVAPAPTSSTASASSASEEPVQLPHRFEPTLTLEALRKRVAAFADERDWDQVRA
jgi:hypothetical protein